MIPSLSAQGFPQFILNMNGTPYTWAPVAATSGTDSAFTASTAMVASIFLAGTQRLTGLNLLIGATGGTDKWIVSVHNVVTGALLANSAVAGVLVGTAANSQQIPFTAPVTLQGPGHYLISVISNGTTATIRTLPAQCGITGLLCGTSTVTFGTPVAITPPTAFATGSGFCAGVY